MINAGHHALAEQALEHGILEMPCPDCESGIDRVRLDDDGNIVGGHGTARYGHAHDDAHWYCSDARAQGIIDTLARAYLDLCRWHRILQTSVALHPYGHCDCGGEGKCGWCEWSNALEELSKLKRSALERTPAGTQLCYLCAGELVLLGDPDPEEDPEAPGAHNCDALGCGSMSHVKERHRLTTEQLERLRAGERVGLNEGGGPGAAPGCKVGKC
jgi:hypothetical protein